MVHIDIFKFSKIGIEKNNYMEDAKQFRTILLWQVTRHKSKWNKAGTVLNRSEPFRALAILHGNNNPLWTVFPTTGFLGNCCEPFREYGWYLNVWMYERAPALLCVSLLFWFAVYRTPALLCMSRLLWLAVYGRLCWALAAVRLGRWPSFACLCYCDLHSGVGSPLRVSAIVLCSLWEALL